VAYNPNIFQEALQARRLTPAQLSRRLGIDLNQLNRELRREPEPKADLLRSLARELALPPFAFYMEHLPEVHETIPDFRSTNPAPTAKTRETLESIKFAEGIQKTMIDLDAVAVSNLPRFNATTDDDIDMFARKVRDNFGISLEDQQEQRTPGRFTLPFAEKSKIGAS
jgi:transcriptional regulator with XRE-family HTH domain